MEQLEQLLRVYQRREQLKRRIAERKVALLTHEKQLLLANHDSSTANNNGNENNNNVNINVLMDGTTTTTMTTTAQSPLTRKDDQHKAQQISPTNVATGLSALESEEALLEKIRTLQSLLFEANNKIHRDAVLVTRLHQSRVVIEALYSGVDTGSGSDNSAESVGRSNAISEEFHRKVKELMEERDEKVKKYFEVLSQFQQLQHLLFEAEEDTKQLNEKNRATYQLLKEANDKADAESNNNNKKRKQPQEDELNKVNGEEAEDEPEAQMKKRLSALQSITKALILESPVNWAEDDNLRKIVLSS
eukprot:TRINITY_DN1059_c0_g2_i1.p1 TRINITY_DN1059_c0_g2~~TRINITY_DN1059_c0_g2_i1.p1  ORF type:complete len:321 (+),score=119.94 TRINITY_DN1059_c0_g2_i1:53-964(+)